MLAKWLYRAQLKWRSVTAVNDTPRILAYPGPRAEEQLPVVCLIYLTQCVYHLLHLNIQGLFNNMTITITRTRQKLSMISGPPSDFWCPLLSPPPLLTSRFSPLLPSTETLVASAIYAWHWSQRMIKMPQRNASYHQFQRFVLHLRFHIDDPPRNSLWKWKPSPASAARKCGDVIHFALTHSSGRAVSHGGGGMVMAVQWTNAAIGQIFPKEARP